MLTILLLLQPALLAAQSTCGLSIKCSKGTCLPDQKEDVDVVFDLSPLHHTSNASGREADDWTRKDLNGFDWYSNVCGDTARECNGQHGAVIAVDSLGDCSVLANNFAKPFSLLDASNARKGVTVMYDRQDITCTNKVTINIHCDPRASTTSITNAEKIRDCEFLLEFVSTAACPMIYTPESAVAHGMSGFSVFLIIIVCFLCIYCIGYSLYNYHVHGERGLAVVPHPDFWFDTLPNTLKEVCGRCSEGLQDCCGAVSDRLRGMRSESSSSWVSSSFRSARAGAGPEYEKIEGGHGSGSHAQTEADLEADDELDDEDNGGSTGPGQKASNKRQPGE